MKLRALLVCLLIVLAPLPAHAVGAWVQNASPAGSDAGSTTISSGAFGSSVGAGSALLYFVTYFHASVEQTVTVTGNSNTFVECGHTWNIANGFGYRWGYAKNVNAGTTAMLATYGASVSLRGFKVAEYASVATTGSVVVECPGQFMATPGSGANAWTSGTTTPGFQPAIVVAMAVNLAGSGSPLNPTAGTGMTARGSSTFNYGYGGAGWETLADKRITSLSSVAGTFTGPATYGVIAMMVVREPSSSKFMLIRRKH